VRILSITPAFAPQIGGIEQVVQELAVRLSAVGHQVDIAHISNLHRSMSCEDIAGLTVYRLPLRGHRLIGWAPDLGKLAKGYDLLHVHDPQLMAISANVRWSCPQVPAVLSTHGGFRHTRKLSWFKSMFERTLMRRTLAHFGRVLASSENDLAYFKYYTDRAVLCANGVNTDKFGTVRSTPNRSPCQWVYWGRLSHNKRVDLLIEYVALAHQLGYPVNLLICGRDFDGIADQLKKQVKRLNLDGCIQFESHLSDSALLRELAHRALYITASEHEGFGLSIVEAMAAGLLVACRNAAPLNDFVENGVSGHFLAFDHGQNDVNTLHAMFARDTDSVEAGAQAARAKAAHYNWTAAAKAFSTQFELVLQK
jgi:alpha-1,3-mannosyltransferase